MTKRFTCLFVLLFIFGCARKLEIDANSLLSKGANELDGEKYVLIIPQNGCSTCVNKAYGFMLSHFDNPSIKYVFTHYSSKKAIKVRLNLLGEKDISHIGFIELPLVLEHGLSRMYPALLELKGDGTALVTLMNQPDGSDWELLETQLD